MPKRAATEVPNPTMSAVLAVGQQMRCIGLQACPDLNGLCCTLLDFNQETGRWTTKIQDGRLRNLKPANLEHVTVDSHVAGCGATVKQVRSRRPVASPARCGSYQEAEPSTPANGQQTRKAKDSSAEKKTKRKVRAASSAASIEVVKAAEAVPLPTADEQNAKPSGVQKKPRAKSKAKAKADEAAPAASSCERTVGGIADEPSGSAKQPKRRGRKSEVKHPSCVNEAEPSTPSPKKARIGAFGCRLFKKTSREEAKVKQMTREADGAQTKAVPSQSGRGRGRGSGRGSRGAKKVEATIGPCQAKAVDEAMKVDTKTLPCESQVGDKALKDTKRARSKAKARAKAEVKEPATDVAMVDPSSCPKKRARNARSDKQAAEKGPQEDKIPNAKDVEHGSRPTEEASSTPAAMADVEKENPAKAKAKRKAKAKALPSGPPAADDAKVTAVPASSNSPQKVKVGRFSSRALKKPSKTESTIQSEQQEAVTTESKGGRGRGHPAKVEATGVDQGQQGKSRGRGRGIKRKAVSETDAQKAADPVRTAEKGSGEEMESLGDSPAAGLEEWEQKFWEKGYPVVAGTDEAGRGPLAGPVVAAAFAVLSHEDAEVRALLAQVNDSKKMSADQRDRVYAQLTDPKFHGRTAWAIAEASVEEIDESNILRASLLAMSRAVHDLEVRPGCVLVDGCNRPPELLGKGERWTRGSKKDAEAERNQQKLAKWFKPKQTAEVVEPPPWRPDHVEAVIEGDGKVPSISAASVLAKVRRDQLMEDLHKRYPSYGFASHKGYGTEEHLEAIKKHGVCPEHRRSFGPVREIIGGGDAD